MADKACVWCQTPATHITDLGLCAACWVDDMYESFEGQGTFTLDILQKAEEAARKRLEHRPTWVGWEEGHYLNLPHGERARFNTQMH